MLHILHGENAVLRREALAAAVDRSGLSPDFGDINTETLEGNASMGDMRRACLTVPFLGEVRVVIARDVLAALKGDDVQELADFLPMVPSTTCLIFDEDRTLPKRHPVLSAAAALGAEVVLCALPDTRDLPQWIRERTERYGAKIEPRAALLLAQNIGMNLLLLDQEVQKLLLYVGQGVTVTVDDVLVMVPYVQSADVIFQMVDALGQRDASLAATHLHRLLEVGEHPLGIFGMVVRQFRLLLQVRWMSDRRHTQAQIVSRLKLHPFVVSKIYAQAGRFTAGQLRDAYRLLYRTDVAVKRGEVPTELALDMLIAQLTRL
ncbi:MAG: DNA polymerase III subunit delta [Anaerolineae bacterium]|jgi:DNA polymerase-3 subunit delta|nr:DNA polymerase III subunit delta [Anaerolineae bacterium]